MVSVGSNLALCAGVIDLRSAGEAVRAAERCFPATQLVAKALLQRGGRAPGFCWSLGSRGPRVFLLSCCMDTGIFNFYYFSPLYQLGWVPCAKRRGPAGEPGAALSLHSLCSGLEAAQPLALLSIPPASAEPLTHRKGHSGVLGPSTCIAMGWTSFPAPDLGCSARRPQKLAVQCSQPSRFGLTARPRAQPKAGAGAARWL